MPFSLSNQEPVRIETLQEKSISQVTWWPYTGVLNFTVSLTSYEEGAAVFFLVHLIDSELSRLCLGLNPGWVHCTVLFSRTLYYQYFSPSRCTNEYRRIEFNSLHATVLRAGGLLGLKTEPTSSRYFYKLS